MKLIIAGGRDYDLGEAQYAWLDEIHSSYGVTEVVSGGAHGADAGGELWALKRGLPVKIFTAEWARYDRSAGPRRNQQMALYAEALALFPGGRGTANMRTVAAARKLLFFRYLGN